MAEKIDKLGSMVPCLLEAIKTFNMDRRSVKLEDLAKELGINPEEAEKLVNLAIKEGLLESFEGLKLTEKGEALVRIHRESYIHNKYAHGTGLFGRIAKFLERRERSMRFHWRRRHGLDDKAINRFYSSIETLKGRVEETVPLTSLAEGERGVVSYVLGGYGMVRRLTEMGLTPGTTVRVLRRGLLRGPVQIEVRGSCLALGHGVASRVFVKPLKSGHHD